MFSNLFVFRLTKAWSLTSAMLDGIIAKNEFVACQPREAKSIGWTSVYEDGPKHISTERCTLLAVKIETKTVPGDVLKRRVKKMVQSFEKEKGYKPGRKEQKMMKEEAYDQLLPKVLEKQSLVRLIIDQKDGWITVDTSSAPKCDDVIRFLLRAVDGIPLASVKSNRNPAEAMAEWLTTGDAPDDFSIDRDCELKGTEEEKPMVRYARLSLEREEIAQHIGEGKRPTRLAMTYKDRLSFVLTDKFQIKKLELLDSGTEEKPRSDEEMETVAQSNLTILSRELRRFLPALLEGLGGEGDYSSI